MSSYFFAKSKPAFVDRMPTGAILDAVQALPEMLGMFTEDDFMRYHRDTQQIELVIGTTLTSQQITVAEQVIVSYPLIDTEAIKAAAIQRQKQDDFFGLTRTEALDWITNQLDTPTSTLGPAIDALSIPQNAKDVMHALRIIQVRHNRAFRKITEKIYDLVDTIEPTINRRNGT